MLRYLLLVAAVMLAGMGQSIAKEDKAIVDHNTMLMDHGGGHLMDMGGGMVMGQNTDTLPGGCDRISEEAEITVKAGHKYAKPFPGRIYAFDKQDFNFKPCTKLTVNFINEDSVRHQWMMHGLPKYLYPKGMFHLEVTGPGKISGTLILPSGDKTYLVHCDLAQHMEKGMKAQLKVGNGSGDLPSIPGVTDYVISDQYTIGPLGAAGPAAVSPAGQEARAAPAESAPLFSGVTVIGLAVGLIGAVLLARKFKGMSAAEIIAYLIDLAKTLVNLSVKAVNAVVRFVSSLINKNKALPEK